jgi:hypothetical protein
MPDAPAQDVSPEGEPQGRSAPGGGKIFGFPWWVWLLAAGGTFAVVWYMRNQSGSSVTSSTQTGSALGPGSAVGTSNGSGVSFTDPMTASALLQAMQDLATRLGASSVSPAPSAPASHAYYNTRPVSTGAFTSSHVTGGSSTDLSTVSGLPDIVKPLAVIAAAAYQTTSDWAAANPAAPVQVTTVVAKAPAAPTVDLSWLPIIGPFLGPVPAGKAPATAPPIKIANLAQLRAGARPGEK